MTKENGIRLLHLSLFVWGEDENLTKAHIRYLEGALIVLAGQSNAVELLNSASSGAKLPESDQAEMDVFLEKVLQLLPLLSLGNAVDVFNVIDSNASQEVDFLTCSIKGLIATGKRTSKGFVVFKGSQAVKEYRASAANWIIKRDMHLASGLLVDRGEHYIFAQDYEFSSPSAAGAIVRGGSTNGLTSWRNQSGVQLKDLDTL